MVKRRAVRASLLGVAVALPALAYLGRAFLVAPPAGAVQRAAPTHQGEGHFATQNGIETSAVALPALGCLAAAAAARLLMRRPAAPSTQLVPLAGGALTCYEEADAPAVVMHSDGGRRKRLGIPGKICMLTGTRKFKGIRRTYHLKKNGRYWRPNCRWMRLWWGREKKWVSLYISMRGLRKVDRYGLEEAARWAGLDLYAWSKEHWEPGSRQPLCLRFGITSQAEKDRKQWPDYIKHLNKGAPLAEKFAGPPKFKKPVPWAVRKMKQQRLEAMGPPPGLKVEMKTPTETMQTESC